MQHVTHKSWIATVAEEFEKWRAKEQRSREKHVQAVVDYFEANEAPASWGFEFSSHADIFQRQRNNADKVYRWLDDVSKDNNLMNLNFARVLMAAMPREHSLACAASMMASLGFAVRMLDESDETNLELSQVFDSQLVHTKAMHFATIACQNPTPENLELADLHLTQATAKTKFLTRVVSGLKAKAAKAKAATGAAINKALHRGHA
jgi:hypothetical protein